MLGLASVASLALLAPAAAHLRPPAPPPQHAPDSPPPAWIATSSLSIWLAYGSYCWTTMCVDFLPPRLRDDIPRLQIRPRTRVEVHLGFQPQRVVVSGVGWSRALQARRIVSYVANHDGIVLIAAVGPGGEASYLVRLRLVR
jgi:hypothetical protein